MHEGHIDRALQPFAADTAASCKPVSIAEIADGAVSGIAAVGEGDFFAVHSFETRAPVIGQKNILVPQTSIL